MSVISSSYHITFSFAFHYSFCRIFVSLYILLKILSPQSTISGIIKYIYPAFVDCVFPAASRNYPTYFISGAVAWKICAIYNDIRHGQVRLMLESLNI